VIVAGVEFRILQLLFLAVPIDARETIALCLFAVLLSTFRGRIFE